MNRWPRRGVFLVSTEPVQAMPDEFGRIIRRVVQRAVGRIAAHGRKEGVKAMSSNASVPWILWPFWALWRLIAGIIIVTGRIVGAILGLVFMIAGIALSLTVVGAIVGVPLVVFGLLLMARSIF